MVAKTASILPMEAHRYEPIIYMIKNNNVAL